MSWSQRNVCPAAGEVLTGVYAGWGRTPPQKVRPVRQQSFVFESNFSAQHGAETYNPKIKSRSLYPRSQPRALIAELGI